MTMILKSYLSTGSSHKRIPAFKLAVSDHVFPFITSYLPFKRFGTVEEFAAAAAFLVSERASYITGQSLAVDGGWIKGH